MIKVKVLTKEERKEMVWEDWTAGKISDVRFEEMMRTIESRFNDDGTLKEMQ